MIQRRRTGAWIIPGSHKERRLRAHHTYEGTDVTLNQELNEDEFDENTAVDMVLKAGQVSLHDVFLLHGSEANNSDKSRRGMTLRYICLLYTSPSPRDPE